MPSATANARFSLCAIAALAWLALPTEAQSQANAVAAAPKPWPPTPIIVVPGGNTPVQGPFDAPAGRPAYRPQLPEGTPTDQVRRDPSLPVTTFVDALQRAYWTNPQILAERAETRSIDYRVPQARSQYGPSLQYSASYDYRHDIFQQSAASSIQHGGWTSTASAILSQPLFSFGRLRATEDRARAQVAFQRASLAAREQQVLLNAINAYASVLRDRAGVGIAQSQVDLLAREFSDTQTRLEQHDTTAADLRQVETRLELARAQLLTAQAAAVSSDATFLSTVGAPAGELQPPNPLAVPARTLEDGYVYADAHNPVIASAYARERVSRAGLDFSRADLLPQVDLRGQANLGSVPTVTGNLRETEMLGGVTLSGTFDSGGKFARTQEAAAANDSDWRLIDSALRENRAELAEAWSGWQSQLEAIERLQIATQAAELALLGAQEQERAGLRTTTEILDLTRDLLQVRSSLNTARADAYVQQARVLAAMGALQHDNLLPDSESYDPSEHFRSVEGKADFPVLTPLVRALDSLATPERADRPIRDPAGPLAIGSASPEVTR